MNRPLVYLAGPYTLPDPVENTHRVIKVADKLLEDGIVTPYVPHLSMLWHLVSPKPINIWYEYDLEVLIHCDALFRITGDSTGADAEVEMAQNHGLKVFDELERLYGWASG